LFHPLFGPSVRARLKRAREDMMSNAPIGSRASQENSALVDLGSAAGRSSTAITAWDQLQLKISSMTYDYTTSDAHDSKEPLPGDSTRNEPDISD
jgi:hypothetical protein